jgi:hypothetical protein
VVASGVAPEPRALTKLLRESARAAGIMAPRVAIMNANLLRVNEVVALTLIPLAGGTFFVFDFDKPSQLVTTYLYEPSQVEHVDASARAAEVRIGVFSRLLAPMVRCANAWFQPGGFKRSQASWAATTARHSTFSRRDRLAKLLGSKGGRSAANRSTYLQISNRA